MNKKLEIAIFIFVLLFRFNFILGIYTNKLKKINSNSLKLLATVVLVRHGARAPLVEFKENKMLYFGTKKTHLTINGVRQHILLGRWLRRRYVEGDIFKLFNKNFFNPNEILVYSSPRQRTIFSAVSNILGLFPQSIPKIKYLNVDEVVKTDDIPPIFNYTLGEEKRNEYYVNVIDRMHDNMFKVKNCRRPNSKLSLVKSYKKHKIFHISKLERIEAIDDILSKYSKLFESEFFVNLFKNQKYSKVCLRRIDDLIRQRVYHHKEILDLKNETVLTLKKFRINKFYSLVLEESDYKRLYISAILEKILALFSLKTNLNQKESHEEISKEVKFVMFSGHDTTLINLISNLFNIEFLTKKIHKSLENEKDFKFIIPPLASSFIIELYTFNNKFYIKIVYNGEEITTNFKRKINFNKELKLLEYKGFHDLLLSRYDKSYKLLEYCGVKYR